MSIWLDTQRLNLLSENDNGKNMNKRDGATNALTALLSPHYALKATTMRARLGQLAKRAGLGGVSEMDDFLGKVARVRQPRVVAPMVPEIIEHNGIKYKRV